MRSIFILFLFLQAAVGFGHLQPAVRLNHLFVILSKEDLLAIDNSDFVKDELTAYDMRTTFANDSDTWTGVYFMGTTNYIELLDTRYSDLGRCGFGFGVEHIGELKTLDESLKTKHETEYFLQTKSIEGAKIPWFHGILVDNSVYSKTPLMNVWVMEYDTVFFNYKKLSHKGGAVTSEAYLKNFEESRKGKVIERFTGVTLKLSKIEMVYFRKFLLSIGFKSANGRTFSSGDFYFKIKEMQQGDKNTIESITFKATRNFKKLKKIISSNVTVQIEKNHGLIIFNR